MKTIQQKEMYQKRVIYEKTVYGMNAVLKKGSLTSNGAFDLGKIPELRVASGELLKLLREITRKTQRELALLAGVPLRTWIGWEFYNKAMPFHKVIHISEKIGMKKVALYLLIAKCKCKFTAGNHHGRHRIALPLRPQNLQLLPYLIPHENGKVYVIKNCPNKTKEELLRNFSIDKTYYKKTGLIVIYSQTLNRFLTTFYNYQKEPLLRFPLSTEVFDWKQKGVDLNIIILALLLTDGGEKSNGRLFFSGASKTLHNIWSDAWFYSYNLLPSSFCAAYRSIFVTTHNVSGNILSELKELCPLFKTSPIYESIESYMNKPQPTIKYIFHKNKLEQQIAIRLWANTEGSIGIQLDRDTKLICPALKIACAHPTLIRELQKLCRINGMNPLIERSTKVWSGVSVLKSTSIKTAIQFLNIGGFLKGTLISSKSTYFSGLDKQDVLLSILELMIMQRKKKKHRTTDLHKVYDNIRKIAIHKEFKPKEYYLSVFKSHDNWSFRR